MCGDEKGRFDGEGWAKSWRHSALHFNHPASHDVANTSLILAKCKCLYSIRIDLGQLYGTAPPGWVVFSIAWC